MYNLYATDIMRKDLTFLTYESSFDDLKELLQTSEHASYPLVDAPSKSKLLKTGLVSTKVCFYIFVLANLCLKIYFCDLHVHVAAGICTNNTPCKYSSSIPICTINYFSLLHISASHSGVYHYFTAILVYRSLPQGLVS